MQKKTLDQKLSRAEIQKRYRDKLKADLRIELRILVPANKYKKCLKAVKDIINSKK